MKSAKLEALVDACTASNYSAGPRACFIDTNEVNIDNLKDACDSMDESISIIPLTLKTPVHPVGVYAINEDVESSGEEVSTIDDLVEIAETIEALGEPIDFIETPDYVKLIIEDDPDGVVNSSILEYLKQYEKFIDIVGGSTPDEIILKLKN